MKPLFLIIIVALLPLSLNAQISSNTVFNGTYITNIAFTNANTVTFEEQTIVQLYLAGQTGEFKCSSVFVCVIIMIEIEEDAVAVIARLLLPSKFS